jgi:hypothetical protein
LHQHCHVFPFGVETKPLSRYGIFRTDGRARSFGGMNGFAVFWISASVALTVAAGSAGYANAQPRADTLPSEVVDLVNRRAACVEWSLKAFDPKLATQVDTIMDIQRSLKCEDIKDIEQSLKQKYASEPVILAALRARWVKIVKRLPVQVSVPPASDPAP